MRALSFVQKKIYIHLLLLSVVFAVLLYIPYKENEYTRKQSNIRVEAESTQQDTPLSQNVGQRIPSYRIKEVRLETQNKNVVVIGVNDVGDDLLLSESEIDRVKSGLADGEIRIATKGSDVALASRGIAFVSEFPIIVNLQTRGVTMVIPDSEKTIYFLPDKIFEQLLGSGTITSLEGDEEKTAALKESVGTLRGYMTLLLQQGEPVYYVDAKKLYNIFGVFPATFPLQVTISAYSGRVLNVDKSLVATVVDILSP